MKSILKSYREIKKLPDFIFFIVALIMKTSKLFFMRTRIVDPHNLLKTKRMPFITVTWHNRLLYFPAMIPKKHRFMTFALISPSRDGQYVADLCKHFGIRCVRGSSNKRGAAALKEAINVIENSHNLSMTPDGPRGPKYRMSQGAVILASLTGKPVIPVIVNASKYWELKSWDNFQIPKPGAKLKIVFGGRIFVPPNLDSFQIEKWRVYVEKKLMAITVDK